MDKKIIKWIYLAIPEAASYMLLYYVQLLFKIDGNLWTNSLALLILINILVIFCPIAKKYCCQ